MTRPFPPDLPDPEPRGPTIWAAREIRPEARSEAATLGWCAWIVAVAAVLVVGVVLWGFA